MGFLFLFLFLIVGCGGTSSPVKVHEGSKESVQPTPNISGASSDMSKNAAAATFAKLTTLATAKSEYFKLSNWEDAQIATSDEFRAFIDRNHQELLKLSANERWPELAEFYLSLCDQNFENCKFQNTLRSSAYSSSLMVEVSTLQSDINKKYKLILMAFDLNNAVFSDKTAKTFLADIKMYRKSLVEDNNKRLLSKVDGLIQILLTRVQSGQLTTDTQDWVTSLSLLESLDHNHNYLGGKNLTVLEGDKIVAKDDLIEQIARTQKLTSSYTNKMAWMTENMPKLLEQFSIKPLELDPQFFIIEQLMTDQWSVKQAEAFFRGAGLKFDSFPDVVQSYMKTQIVYLLGVSQSELRNFLKESDKRDVIFFFDDAKAKLSKSALFARSLSQRIHKLVDFANQIDRESKATTEISKIKENFDKSLKVSLTIPLTFAIFDIGNRLGVSPLARIPITKYHLGGQMPYETLLIKFFRGQIVPLLDYTIDMNESNAFEISEGIEFALRSGILENLNTTADEAMARFIDLYLQTNVYEQYLSPSYVYPSKLTVLQKEITELEQIKNESNFRYVMATCQGMKQAGGIRRIIQLTDMVKSPSVGPQAFKFFSSGTSDTLSTTNKNRTVRTDLSYNPIAWLRMDALEHLRLDILPSMEMFTTLVNVVEKNGIPMKVSKIKLDHAKGIFKKFVTLFVDFYKSTTSCFQKLVQHERNIGSKAVEYEYAYWKWAFERHRQGLPYKLNFESNLPEGVEYRSKFSTSHMTSFNFDLAIRARIYFTKGLPELGLPPIDPKLEVIFNEGLKKKDIYEQSPMNSVPLPNPSPTAADTFATDAVRSTGFNNRTNGIDWFNAGFVPLDLLETNIYGLAMFYRIAPYLKQSLDIDINYTTKELIQDHLDIVNFVNLKSNEIPALKMLGRNSLYPLYLRYSQNWILDAENKPVPIMDILLKQVPGRWMGSYGRKDIYENPNNDMRIVRPPNLVPFTEQGINLYYFLNEQKLGKHHLFQNLVSASSDVVQHYNRLFKDDSENLMKLTRDVRSTPSVTVTIDLKVGPVELKGYSPVFIENIEANIEKFHQETGGIFRAQ